MQSSAQGRSNTLFVEHTKPIKQALKVTERTAEQIAESIALIERRADQHMAHIIIVRETPEYLGVKIEIFTNPRNGDYRYIVYGREADRLPNGYATGGGLQIVKTGRGESPSDAFAKANTWRKTIYAKQVKTTSLFTKTAALPAGVLS